MTRVQVVGAGLGGLAAAIRLAHAGYDVEVLEKTGVVGGKLRDMRARTPAGAFRWDAGPTMLTLPGVLEELFATCGERLADRLTLRRARPDCRYFWTDGSRVDQDRAFWSRPEVARYLDHAGGIDALSRELFLDHAPTEAWRGLRLSSLRGLRHLPRLAGLESLAELNRRCFADPHTRQIFHRFATYNGSSPYLTPATFAVIAHAEATTGSWYPRGGMARIADALRDLAERRGVRFRLHSEVHDLTELDAEVVVCNADALTAHARWLGTAPRSRPLPDHPPSCSTYLLWLGVRGEHPQLAHHNVLFSNRYHAEFEDIFVRRQLPREPTLYLGVSGTGEPDDAPAGHQNWTLMVNVPADPQLDTRGYDRVVLERLARFGIALDPADIVVQRRFGPRNFARRDNAWQGALYGWASHSRRSAFLRPALRHPLQRRLFFVGGTTHPGGGIPLVLRSGKIVAGMVQRAYPPR